MTVKVIHPKSHKDIHSKRQYVEVNKPDKTDRQWLAKYKGSSSRVKIKVPQKTSLE